MYDSHVFTVHTSSKCFQLSITITHFFDATIPSSKSLQEGSARITSSFSSISTVQLSSDISFCICSSLGFGLFFISSSVSGVPGP